VKWSFETKNLGNNEAELIFKATIEKNWHLYSQDIPDGGPIKTSFFFNKIEGFEFIDEIKGGSIPREFIPAVEKGIKEAVGKGVMAGYPMVDVAVTLYDGSFHEVDSSEFAFKIAGSMAFQDGARKAGLILLEPIMKLEIVVPSEYFGDIIGDLSSRRGQIKETKDRLNLKVIDGEAPLAEMFGYATTIRSLTKGRGTFTMEFDHYGETPQNIAQGIVEGRSK